MAAVQRQIGVYIQCLCNLKSQTHFALNISQLHSFTLLSAIATNDGSMQRQARSEIAHQYFKSIYTIPTPGPRSSFILIPKTPTEEQNFGMCLLCHSGHAMNHLCRLWNTNKIPECIDSACISKTSLTCCASLSFSTSTLSPVVSRPARPARPTICLYWLSVTSEPPTLGERRITLQYMCNKATNVTQMHKKKTSM